MSQLFQLVNRLKQLANSNSEFEELYPALKAVINDSESRIDSCSKGSTKGCGMGCLGS